MTEKAPGEWARIAQTNEKAPSGLSNATDPRKATTIPGTTPEAQAKANRPMKRASKSKSAGGGKCPVCTSQLAPTWNARPSCPVCDRLTGDHGAYLRARPVPSEAAVALVRKVEPVALSRGWTRGELWSTAGWWPARGFVCVVHDGDRVVACDERRIVLESGRGVRSTFWRSDVAAGVSAPEA